MAKIALADDHALLRNGLASLLKNMGHIIVFEADNGNDLVQKINSQKLPDIVLMDINMPGMDGCETTGWLRSNYPSVKVLALSMYDNENAIIRMLKCGARGYIVKDGRPAELQSAIETVMKEGFHYSSLLTGKLINAINQMGDSKTVLSALIHLQEKETDFLRLCCSELTYKEIADKLYVSPRTVDSYRDTLFEKLHVKTRIGLVMFAVRNGLVQF